jgi:hypothetical protein
MANKILYLGKDSMNKDIYVDVNQGEHYVGIGKNTLGDNKVLFIQYQKFYEKFYNQQNQNALSEAK